ncbi:hypothetical protein EYF80_042190 [Liparis tanakae]|uniref:Uncharacterized protein n=1 Tax=Liparis tanakae TaxID=230148 RepID=A0A4Z2G4V7_9TELE|nr:hypothetical protein EYF80_042190 [Liparis tanakae]
MWESLRALESMVPVLVPGVPSPVPVPDVPVPSFPVPDVPVPSVPSPVPDPDVPVPNVPPAPGSPHPAAVPVCPSFLCSVAFPSSHSSPCLVTWSRSHRAPTIVVSSRAAGLSPVTSQRLKAPAKLDLVLSTIGWWLSEASLESELKQFLPYKVLIRWTGFLRSIKRHRREQFILVAVMHPSTSPSPPSLHGSISFNSSFHQLISTTRQGSPDDAVNLFVDVQFGQAAALRVVGHTDGHRLGALGNRHCDLEQLQKEQRREGEKSQRDTSQEKLKAESLLGHGDEPSQRPCTTQTGLRLKELSRRLQRQDYAGGGACNADISLKLFCGRVPAHSQRVLFPELTSASGIVEQLGPAGLALRSACDIREGAECGHWGLNADDWE